MDIIEIDALRLRCEIGFSPHEAGVKQDVVITMRIGTDMRRAGMTDDPADAFNYRTVAKAIIGHVEASHYKLVEALAEVLRPSLDTPFVLFGHSMGALISYELVHYWRGHNGPQPVHLMVSGHRAPHRPALNPTVHQADDTTFLNRLKNLGGTPARFFEMEDLVRLTLPALRADFSVWENYQHQVRPPLEMPLTTFGGRWDSEAREEDFHAWAQHTAGRFAVHLFHGDHFYFRSDLAPLMTHVQEVLGNA